MFLRERGSDSEGVDDEQQIEASGKAGCRAQPAKNFQVGGQFASVAAYGVEEWRIDGPAQGQSSDRRQQQHHARANGLVRDDIPVMQGEHGEDHRKGGRRDQPTKCLWSHGRVLLRFG